MNTFLTKLAWMLAAGWVFLAACTAPPVEQYPITELSHPACEGKRVNPVVQTDAHVQLWMSEAPDVFEVIDFRNGAAQPDPLWSGGDPQVAVYPGQVCLRGSFEGESCLEEYFRRQFCWSRD